MNEKEIYNYINQVIEAKLNSLKLLNGQYHFGVVHELISTNKCKVVIENNLNPVTVTKSPDHTFVVGDRVLILYVNGNARDKVVLMKL